MLLYELEGVNSKDTKLYIALSVWNFFFMYSLISKTIIDDSHDEIYLT